MKELELKAVTFGDNPSSFLSKFCFELFFQCTEELKEKQEFKVMYISCSVSEENQQVLGIFSAGPMLPGEHRVPIQATAPDVNKIPNSDAVGVAGLLILCSYRGEDFMQIFHNVFNYYENEAPAHSSQTPQFDKIMRYVILYAVRSSPK